jgi:hypothetical protein
MRRPYGRERYDGPGYRANGAVTCAGEGQAGQAFQVLAAERVDVAALVVVDRALLLLKHSNAYKLFTRHGIRTVHA